MSFFNSGLMTAVFNAGGIWPARKEWFMIFVMSGGTAEKLVFSRAEGKGSSAQVDGFNFLMTSSTSSCVTLEKELRGWTVWTVSRQFGRVRQQWWRGVSGRY